MAQKTINSLFHSFDPMIPDDTAEGQIMHIMGLQCGKIERSFHFNTFIVCIELWYIFLTRLIPKPQLSLLDI
jgi:hypothetical protein